MDPNRTDDLEDTARIDRRNTVLAQIEAALMADKLAVEAKKGADPYNSGVYPRVAGDVWRRRTR